LAACREQLGMQTSQGISMLLQDRRNQTTFQSMVAASGLCSFSVENMFIIKSYITVKQMIFSMQTSKIKMQQIQYFKLISNNLPFDRPC